MRLATGRGPNIVVVHAHDLGRHLGCYGRGVSTPHADGFSREGVRFDRAFTPSPQCSPSRAAMSTGRYPHRNGMIGLAHMGWSLTDAGQALPWQLRGLGYATYLFGEQHEARSADVLGYQHAHATEWPQLAHEVAAQFDAAVPDLLAHAPFFASVGFFEAHRPYDHPGYHDDDPGEVRVPPYLPDTPEVRQDIARLNGRAKAVDDGLGRVLAALEHAGASDDTLVVFTTDHGIPFPRAKGTLYDSGLEVALLLRGPGVKTGGRVCDHLTANLDLAPTLIELAGGEPAADLDGRSFLPWLEDASFQPREELMCEMTWHDRYAPVRGIRTPRWKYVRYFGHEPRPYVPADVADSPSGRAFPPPRPPSKARERLHDLEADPGEFQNLAGEAGTDEVIRDLRERLDTWMHDTRDPILDAFGA